MVRALGVQLHGLVALTRIVLADDLDEPAIARARRFGDDNAEGRRVLATNAAKSNSNCHGAFLLLGVLVQPLGSSRLRRFRNAPSNSSCYRIPIMPGGNPMPPA